MTDHQTQPGRFDALEELRALADALGQALAVNENSGCSTPTPDRDKWHTVGDALIAARRAIASLSAAPAQQATPAEAAALLVDLWANLDPKRKDAVVYAAEDALGMGAGGWDMENPHGIVAAVLSAIAAEAGR